jgi:futalosine hydrolase
MADLILVPTQLELDRIRPRLSQRFADRECSFQLCGFGPIAAAARGGALIARYKPERVLLIGIAGSYVERLHLGSAYRFDTVACDGIGVGTGASFQSAGELGWPHFSSGDTQPKLGDRISLDSAYVAGIPSAGTLLTCCAASATADQAQSRRQRYPDVVAEDMEGFAVALACVLARTPCQIVRGISNQAGDRDHRGWEIETALLAAADLAGDLIPTTWLPTP